MNLEVHGKRTRLYPELKVGDNVKIYTKKKLFDKARVSVWSSNTYDIESINYNHNQTFYKTTAGDRQYMRHELLKV